MMPCSLENILFLNYLMYIIITYFPLKILFKILLANNLNLNLNLINLYSFSI